MKKMTHLAAQYLAAAGISFLKQQEDDSHTNLGFDPKSGLLSSRALGDKGDMLSLNYNNFSLIWHAPDFHERLRLQRRKHQEILNWLSSIASERLDEDYNYDFHYGLNYKISRDFVFEIKSTDRLERLKNLRSLAQQVLEGLVIEYELNSEVRVWPHHFDTGAYSPLKDREGRSVGLGLAIPDDVCSTHYFYVSGYEDGQRMDTSDFNSLSHGSWKNDSFKGAILPVKEVSEHMAKDFFEDAINSYNL